MHRDHDVFIQSLVGQQKVVLRFFSKDDGAILTRLCAPLDYGPSRRARDQSDRYHFWDYESDRGPHALGLRPEQIESITVAGEPFNPAEFITWSTADSAWFYPRDWGSFS